MEVRITVSTATRRSVLSLILLLFLMGRASAAESIVIVGAGRSGAWDTEVEVANPTDSPLWIQLGADPFFEGACPMQCPWTQLTLPPRGSFKMKSADIFHTVTDGLFTMYVIPQDGVTLPTVRARVENAALPSQAVELAAVRTSTITSFGGAPLSFTSVRRDATGHSNLILSNLDLNGTLNADIEVFSPNGDRLGGTSVSIDPGVVLFLVDVLPALGVTSLDDGQILVTRTSAMGIPWGEVAAVDSVNGVFISIGRNP